MKNIEWKNGDKCVYSHDKKINYTYIGAHPSRDGHFVFNEWKGITYVHNDYLERDLSKDELKLQREKMDIKIEECISALTYLVNVSQENEERLDRLLNNSSNFGESDALCKARLLLAKYQR